MTNPMPLPEAVSLIKRFRESGWRIVLAESCTCGMAAAIMGQVPGASDVFCGSAVTYRESVKSDWLGVDAATLRQFTAESQQTTDEMASCLLQRTSEARWGAAITGHLGPGAPAATDGHVFVSLTRRSTGGEVEKVGSGEFVLTSTNRADRQIEAAESFIRWISDQTLGSEGRG